MSSNVRAQQETYRLFRDHVEKNMRDADNPDLSIIDFDDMKEPGTVFMELPLTGVNRVKSAARWEEQIRTFRKGTRVEAEPKSAYDDSLVYRAYVPFEDVDQKRRHRHRRDSYGDSGQSDYGFDPFRLIVWVFVLLLLLVIAGFKVRGEEWALLARLFISGA